MKLLFCWHVGPLWKSQIFMLQIWFPHRLASLFILLTKLRHSDLLYIVTKTRQRKVTNQFKLWFTNDPQISAMSFHFNDRNVRISSFDNTGKNTSLTTKLCYQVYSCFITRDHEGQLFRFHCNETKNYFLRIRVAQTDPIGRFNYILQTSDGLNRRQCR